MSDNVSIKEKCRTNLVQLNQRQLTKGEIFLLAKAIADKLPLAPNSAGSGGVKEFIAKNMTFISEVVWDISLYSYIDEEKRDEIVTLVTALTLWRSSVAYNPSVYLFRGQADMVVDDLSGLPRYVDSAYFCAVGDMINNANYMLDLFKTHCEYIFNDMIANGRDYGPK